MTKNALQLKEEGNNLYRQNKYQEALEKYDEALALDPAFAIAWYNKGLIHNKLGQYAEALAYLEKALLIDPFYQKAKSQRENILQILNSAEIKEQFNDSCAKQRYATDIFRPIICNKNYLDEMDFLSQKHQKMLQSAPANSFPDQIQATLALLEFLFKYYDNPQQPNALLREELLSSSAEGKKLRLQTIGNKIVYALTSLPEQFAKHMDLTALNIMMQCQKEIFLEDAKKIVRMIFETMYHFPREERGKLINYLPWHENSCYLFDFCGALFIEDEAINKENRLGGISLISYDFNGDLNKQRSLMYYQKSLMHHIPLVKIAIADLIKKDMHSFHSFFQEVALRLNKNQTYDGLQKMQQLPHLYTLLWYSKQMFNLQRLLSILPAVPGNSRPVDSHLLKKMHLNTEFNTAPPIDIEKSFRAWLRVDKPENTKEQNKKAYLALKNTLNNPVLELLIKQMLQNKIPQPISYGMMEHDSYQPIYVSSNAITPLKRMQLASDNNYLNPNTLKGRLAVLRKLQLIGEIFIPRSWGNQYLKKIDYIDPNTLSNIRNGLAHIEDKHYFSIAKKLESDKQQIKKLFRELQTLKEVTYEITAARQEQFPAFPEDNPLFSLTDPDTENFFNHYWDTLKNAYQVVNEVKKEHFIPNEHLLKNQQDINNVLRVVKPEHQDQIRKMLEGSVPYQIENSGVILQDTLNDKKLIKRTKKLLESAEKYYKECWKQNAKINEQNKELINQNISKSMANHYPTISDLGQKLAQAGLKNLPDLSNEALFNLLKNRLDTLEILMKESNVFITGQVELVDALEHDIALQLSTTYLLGQILSLIHKIETIVNWHDIEPKLVARLLDYHALRNVLEHNDPILETAELSYYQMLNKTPQMMASVIGELLLDFKKSILDFDTSTLLNTTPVQVMRTRQDHAINPSNFWSKTGNSISQNEDLDDDEKTNRP